jgi:outer membrane lipoprotein-sorting protein
MTVHEALRRRSFWLAGLGIAATVAVIGVWAWSGGGASKDGSDLPAFYLEARLEAEDASTSIGTQPAGAASGAATTVHREGQVRWLQLSRDEARVEIETLQPVDEAGTDVIVYDGATQWYYRHETNTYSRSPIQPIPDGVTMRVRPWSFGALIGPWYGAAKTVDEFMAELRTMSSLTTDVRTVGKDRVLGRDVVVVEQSPISTSSSGEEETREGTARYWVDETRMVVMRIELDDGLSQRLRIEVTRLEWDPPSGRIEFTPPGGAAERSDLDLGEPEVTPTRR